MQQAKSLIKMRGTALFMALLIIAIVATITTLLMRNQQIDIRRTQMLIDSEQAYLYAQSGVYWAKMKLYDDLQQPLPNDSWPILLRPRIIPNTDAKISAVLQDAESMFNINNFAQLQQQKTTSSSSAASAASAQTGQAGTAATPPTGTSAGGSGATLDSSMQARIFLTNLLSAVNVQLNGDQQQNLLAAITSWVSTSNPSLGNAVDQFDQQYTRLKPPYRAPHAPMLSVSELRTVQGMTPKIYNALLPHIIALPENTSLNMSHASKVIIQASGLNPDNQSAAQSTQGKTSSKYFFLRVDVFLQNQHLVLYTLLLREMDPQNPKLPKTRMLWQSFGTV